ncbi:hypothetical protein [Catellatospora paridis]|uniref:hypothetical protein n=1 Tax=Catellatospora paridis TaxID=1617086 RepID=UPI0012D40334|nr:hypothetical protein [Catellatospora paridis]
MADWEISDEADFAYTADLLEEECRASAPRRGASPHLAITLTELLVVQTHKWFGAADVKLDALVAHGAKDAGSVAYSVRTLPFAGVRKGEFLPIGAPGLLLYEGRPRRFIDLFLILSRDDAASPTAQAVLEEVVATGETLQLPLELATATGFIPESELLAAGLKTAVAVGDLVLARMRQHRPAIIGMFRASWLRGRDNWGIGQHPPQGRFDVSGMSFSFSVVDESE